MKKTKAPTREQIQQVRKLWRPHHPECKEQCTSCPFGTDNDEEFGKVLVKISLATRGTEITQEIIDNARAIVRRDATRSGEFICHQSIYLPGMGTHRPRDQWRQCSGASAYYRDAEGID